MANPAHIAVMGAGQIGQRHIGHILAEPKATVHSIVDPSPESRNFAESKQIAWFPDFASMIASGKPDGILVATPNQLHREHGLAAIEAGIPVLIEKPLSDTIAGGEAIVAAATKAGVPVLTGHHRRHNPMVQRARAIIDEGSLGTLVSVQATFWLMKPDDYFDIPWRREIGAGPVLLNMIHDLDLLRYLCGEIAEVQAFQSKSIRRFAVDETTVVILKFANGALGTVNVSDTIVAPWSWEQTTGENPAYPQTDQTCYTIGGTHGSLSMPRLELWSNEGKRSWWNPFSVERVVTAQQDPLRLQIIQFCKVIRGEEKPLVSASEGLMTLKAISAIQDSAESGKSIKIS